MSDKIRKIRGTNFTKEEELLLLEEVDKEKLIVECKITNKTSSIEKEQAWTRIACRFNSRNLECRSIDQLKSKYDNLKSKARKVVANKRAFLKGTGGGPCTCGDGFDPIIESILKIINIKTVVGHTSKFDSADYDWKEHDIPLLPGHSSTSPIPVREPLLCITGSSSGTGKNESTSNDWSHYVPKKLKEPISKKLRPSVTNPVTTAKAEYYNLKTKYLKLVIEEPLRKEETEKKEEQRRQEEHTKKKNKIFKASYRRASKERRDGEKGRTTTSGRTHKKNVIIRFANSRNE
ncbi:Myb/SANT-like DNA-binding domain [Popillia japonica]|uniref:Regulatory protein zeste n=1 Tax=Popillia japonica TaxID=7064 RepID=A0AAW1J052_POPJA